MCRKFVQREMHSGNAQPGSRSEDNRVGPHRAMASFSSEHQEDDPSLTRKRSVSRLQRQIRTDNAKWWHSHSEWAISGFVPRAVQRVDIIAEGIPKTARHCYYSLRCMDIVFATECVA
jgi:hypothetical protein